MTKNNDHNVNLDNLGKMGGGGQSAQDRQNSLLGFFFGKNQSPSHKAKRQRSRTLRIEELESREMLSVAPLEFNALCYQYADLELRNDYHSYNIIEIEVSDTTDDTLLHVAITEAKNTAEDDLIVVHTTTANHTINLSKEVKIDGTVLGSITIVSYDKAAHEMGAQWNTLTLNAQGTRDSNEKWRVFNINAPGTTVALAGLILTGGKTKDYGGAIRIDSGTVNVSYCTITENMSGAGQHGVYRGSANSVSGQGGGIYNNTHGIVKITNSTISGNLAMSDHASVYGGGIFNYGIMTITNCVIAGNAAEAADFGTNNNAFGGGINNEGIMQITNCTIVGNVIIGKVELGSRAWIQGGGIYHKMSNLTINNTIVANNIGKNADWRYWTSPVLDFFSTDIWQTSGNITGTNNLIGSMTQESSQQVKLQKSQIGVSMDTIRQGFVALPAEIQPGWSAFDITGPEYVAANWNLRIKTGSDLGLLVIDKGNKDVYSRKYTTDVAGNARLLGVSIDIGAYEFLSEVPSLGNDKQETARDLGTIAVAKTINDLYCNEADWYKFTVDHEIRGFVLLSPVNLGYTCALKLTVIGPDSHPQNSTTTETGAERIDFSRLAAGTYYIRVEKSHESPNGYSLTINVGGDDYDIAPNDKGTFGNSTFQTAAKLSTDDIPMWKQTTYDNLIADGNDWFKFNTGGTGTSADYIEIEYTESAGNLNLGLYGTNNELIFPVVVSPIVSSDGKATKRIHLNLPKGEYYINVAGVNTDTYALTISPPIGMGKDFEKPLASYALSGNNTFLRTIKTNGKDLMGDDIGMYFYSFRLAADADEDSMLTVRTFGAQNGTIVIYDENFQPLGEQDIFPAGAMITSMDVNTAISQNGTLTMSSTQSVSQSVGFKLGSSTEVSLTGVKVGMTTEVNANLTTGESWTQSQSEQYGITHNNRVVYNFDMPAAEFQLRPGALGLEAGKTYYLFFKSGVLDKEKQTGYAAVISVTNLPVAATVKPDVPVLTARAESEETVLFTWNYDLKVKDYLLEFRETGGEWLVADEGYSAEVRNAETGKIAVAVSGLEGGMRYEFRLIASNSVGESTSAIQSATTMAALSSISVSNASPKVGDTITTSLEPAGATATYQWYRGDIAIEDATSSSYTVVSADIGYVFTVIAVGTGDYAGTVETSTSPVPLPAPTELTSTAKTTSTITLAWNGIPNAAGYEIQYRKTGEEKWTNDSVLGTSTTVIDLADNTEYEFQLRAVNANGCSDWSESVFVTTETILVDPPTAPNITSAVSTVHSVTLTWDLQTGLTGYTLKYKKASDKAWSTWTAPAAHETSATITGLDADTAYEFCLTAANDGGSVAAETIAATENYTPEKDVKTLDKLTPTDAQKKDTLQKVNVGKKNQYGAPTYSTLTLFLPDISTGSLLKKNDSNAGYDHVQIQVWGPKNSVTKGKFPLWTTLTAAIGENGYVSTVTSSNAAFKAMVDSSGKLVLSGLDAGTKYSFQIQAVKFGSDGKTAAKGSKVFKAAASTVKYTAVQKLKAPKASVTSSSVMLEWQASKALPAGASARYEIVCMVGSVVEDSKIVDATTAAAITYKFDGLKQSGKKYTFVVRAITELPGGDIITSLSAKVSAKTL